MRKLKRLLYERNNQMLLRKAWLMSELPTYESTLYRKGDAMLLLDRIVDRIQGPPRYSFQYNDTRYSAFGTMHVDPWRLYVPPTLRLCCAA